MVEVVVGGVGGGGEEGEVCEVVVGGEEGEVCEVEGVLQREFGFIPKIGVATVVISMFGRTQVEDWQLHL